MKRALPFVLACAPIWGAVISASIVAKINAPYVQGAQVFQFLWMFAFPFFSIVPITMAKQLSEPTYSKKVELLGAILWLPGCILNYYIMIKLQ